MGVFCCRDSVFKSLTRAAAKAASSRFRRFGALPTAPDWAQRAAVCETCHLRVIHKGVSYCGRPFLELIQRDPAEDGCGCPCHDKAKDPTEHCPLNPFNRRAARDELDACECKWCSAISS